MKFLLVLLTLLPVVSFAADRPNILWLSAEDISPHFGCYGDPHAKTPNVDALAERGVRYTHAFTTAGVCAPCRSGIITGMYQTTIGTHHMRCNAALPDHIRPFPMWMKEAGYYTTNNSKTDYQFKHPKGTWDVSGRKAHWKNRPVAKQPFFAVFNFTGCHESGIASADKYKTVTKDLIDEQRQDAAKLSTLPPYYPDTPVVREDWKRNYELITALDDWVGAHLAELEKQGVADDTIVFFWSDHGVGLPRAKRWLYDSGTWIPLVVQIPEKFRTAGQGAPATVSDQLISSIDLGPTVLNLAGISTPGHMQGQPFLGKDLSDPRKYVFGARDRMDERYDIIRMVRDHRYRYIRNYEPLKPYYQYMNTPEKGATMSELRRVGMEDDLPAAAKLFMAEDKPVEEFYDLQNDPHEIHNLADDPAHAEKMAEFREVHYQWVRDTRDIGLLPEPEIQLREKAAGSRFAILANTDDVTLPTRLGDVAAKASAGPAVLPDLIEALDDPDPGVRYWAATGIGNIGPAASDECYAMIEKKMTTDPSLVVQTAAARAMLRFQSSDGDKGALEVLETVLKGPEEWSRLQAAIVLDEAEDQARPALPALKKALVDQPNKYIVRVANKAVNDLEGTENTVP